MVLQVTQPLSAACVAGVDCGVSGGVSATLMLPQKLFLCAHKPSFKACACLGGAAGGGFAALAALCCGALLAWRQHSRQAAVHHLMLPSPGDVPGAAGAAAANTGLPGAPVQKQGSADSRDPLLKEALQPGVLQRLSCCLGDGWGSAGLDTDLVRRNPASSYKTVSGACEYCSGM